MISAARPQRDASSPSATPRVVPPSSWHARGALVAAASAWLVQLLLLTGALAGLPVGVRVVLAVVARVLGPGLAIGALLPAPPGGAGLLPGWALGYGVAWNALLVLGTRMTGAPFTLLVPWGAVADLALLAACAAIARRRAPVRTFAPVPAVGGWARAAILVAGLVAAAHAARVGTPVTYYSDSPDHIGTIRRMLERGDAFPRDAFFRDAGEAGVDPRKGLWHPQVALIAKLAGADPIETWRTLPVLLSPLFVCNVAALGALLAGGAGAGVAAWAWVLTWGGGLGAQPVRETGFATKLGDQLALATAVAMLADLARRTRGGRVAVVLLGLSAVATHVFAAIQFALVFGAFGVALVIRDRAFGARARRLLVTGVWVALLAAPYLAWRAHGAAHPVNPIHTEPQGLLTLWDHARIVDIGVLWDWMGRLWILIPLAWWPLARAARTLDAALFVLAVSVAVPLVMFDPLAVSVLQPRVGYLLMRMIWMVPLYGVLAWGVPAVVRALVRGPRRAGTIAVAVLGALLLAPVLASSARLIADPSGELSGELAESPLPWRADYQWMERRLPPHQVVLADPATSYGVPMATHHYVVTLVDQHSSPNDPHALARLLDARDALDPEGPWERVREVVGRYGVTVVALNGRFEGIPHLDYWAPEARWYEAERARLDAAPAAFERVYERDRFVVYRVHREALDRLTGGVRRPFVQRWDPRTAPVGRRTGDHLPALLGTWFDRGTVAAGDTLAGVLSWRATEPLPAGSYQVAVRFDRALPGGLQPPAPVAKPFRKVLEHLRHAHYRFRSDHLPAGGEYGVDQWRTDEVVRDSFLVAVPRDAAPGSWTISVRMLRQPHYPNLRLSDYFFENDYFAGVPVGTLTIAGGGR